MSDQENTRYLISNCISAPLFIFLSDNQLFYGKFFLFPLIFDRDFDPIFFGLKQSIAKPPYIAAPWASHEADLRTASVCECSYPWMLHSVS